MGLFKKSIKTSGSSRIADFTVSDLSITDVWMTGSFRALAKPSMLWYNGSTYSLYYKEKEYNNAVGIIKQTGNTLINYAVNTGTATPEPINHPAPMLHINRTTGYIYVLQNKFHIDKIKVWKSDSPEDISSFSYVGEFGSGCSYLGHLEGDESDIVILTRAGTISVDFSISIISVNLDTLVYNQTQITDVKSNIADVRQYLLVPYQYGTSSRTYFGITNRNEEPTGTGYYKFSLMATEKGGAWQEFSNIANTYSKNVVTGSLITDNELETNYQAIGTDSDRTTIISEGKMIVLNDDIYVVFVIDDDNDLWGIRKFTYGSASYTDFLIPLTTIVRSPIWYGSVYMRYNGENFVYTIWEHDGVGGYITKIYTSNLDFSDFKDTGYNTQATSISEPDQGTGCFYGMPTNLHEAVASEESYLLIGKEEGTARGNFKYVITNEAFNS